jgi:hypothetical protein
MRYYGVVPKIVLPLLLEVPQNLQCPLDYPTKPNHFTSPEDSPQAKYQKIHAFASTHLNDTHKLYNHTLSHQTETLGSPSAVPKNFPNRLAGTGAM